MKKELAISRAAQFNGEIHLRLLGYFDLTYWQRDKDIKTIAYTLYKDGSPIKTDIQDKKLTTGCTFSAVPYSRDSQYHGSVLITFQNNTTERHDSKAIKIVDVIIPTASRNKPRPKYARYFSSKENFKASPGCHYFIEILFNEGGFERFKHDRPLQKLENITPITLTRHRLQLYELYSVEGKLSIEEMLTITTALGSFDYVSYAVLTPTADSYKADLPDYETVHDDVSLAQKNDETPDFGSRQEYLDRFSENGFLGMNVREAWHQSQGSQATLRHLDFGIYENHEDLKGNITVASNGITNKNHGTSSAGVIAAINNGIGITGIANECNFIYYDQATTLEPILDDVLPGDIVSLDIQTRKEYPIIADWSWWDKIKKLVDKGAIVLMAAGNGSSDLAALIEEGDMEDFGDTGAFLVGGCMAFNGEIDLYSNFNHYGLLVNSWASPRVVTTGGGDLYKPDETNNRNYTARYAGTSAATPLVAGVAALVQSYAMETYHISLNAAELISVIVKTGFSEGVPSKIGHRPDAQKALIYLDELLSGTQTLSE